jgi:hypothetical protein
MRAQKVLARDFQFYFADLDNIILVECHEDETVTVRASKNNVPDERKISFIRKLAAEGFIPDDYQWFAGPTDGSNGLRWIKDYSWLEQTQKSANRRSNRAMAKILTAACVLWVAMMRILLVSNSPSTDAHASTKPSRMMSLVPGQPLAELERQHQTITDHNTAGNPPLSVPVLEKHRADKLDQHQRDHQISDANAGTGH